MERVNGLPLEDFGKLAKCVKNVLSYCRIFEFYDGHDCRYERFCFSYAVLRQHFCLMLLEVCVFAFHFFLVDDEVCWVMKGTLNRTQFFEREPGKYLYTI
ncbi:hypothetical protein YC2023_011099 [Brassica napus]